MPPTPFQPNHQTPFKSTWSSSQQSRIRHTPCEAEGTPHASISISDIDPAEWTYHAEGGKNILLSFNPAGGVRAGQSPFATSTCTFALRIPKSLPTASSTDDKNEEEEAEQFTRLVVAPLLGDTAILPRCIKIPVITPRDRDIIDTLSARIEMQRPAARRANPARIRSEALSCIYAVEDVTAPVLAATFTSQQQVLCVEIKPKWGFLPRIDSLPPSSPNIEIKAKYSRFRMHKVAKQASSADQLTKEQFEELYDPLDLYSPDAARKQKAVKALWSDWKQSKGKTNNLRLFWNGAVVEPLDIVALDAIAQFLGVEGQAEEQLVEALTHNIVDELSRPRLAEHQSILSRLAHLQSTLDPLDVEGLAHLWLARTQSHTLGHAEPSLDLPAPLTASLPAAQLSAVLEPFLSVTTEVKLDDAVQAFLVSATFKDCSVLLRFVRSDGLQAQTKLVDLDAKPWSKLGAMQSTDSEVCAAFLTWLARIGDPAPAASVAP